MTRLTYIQLLVVNLKQGLPPGAVGYCTKEEAYEGLKKRTGQDFGYDIRAWRRWLSKNMTEEWKWANMHWFL